MLFSKHIKVLKVYYILPVVQRKKGHIFSFGQIQERSVTTKNLKCLPMRMGGNGIEEIRME